MSEGWHAKAEYDYRHFAVGLFIGRRSGEYLTTFDFSNVQATTESRSESERSYGTAPDPRLFLTEEAARALYDALGELYGFPANNAQSLRKDYEHEKQRVDKFIDKFLKG